jgi:hypothetical protein
MRKLVEVYRLALAISVLASILMRDCVQEPFSRLRG